MRINDERTRIAERHRAALRYWIKTRDLTVDGWCKKAGIREGTLRNFLNGNSATLLASNVELLAKALGLSVGQLLREEVHYTADDDLMLNAANAIQEAAAAQQKKLTLEQLMAYTVMLYNYVLEYRNKGSDVAPNEAMAALILKTG